MILYSLLTYVTANNVYNLSPRDLIDDKDIKNRDIVKSFPRRIIAINKTVGNKKAFEIR